MKRFTLCVLLVLAAGMALASTAAMDLYLPAASRSTGAFGTDWKSDVRVFNPGTAAATVNITYMPMAQWASQAATIQVLVPGGDTLNMTNILEEDFGLTPNTAGALHFVSTANIYVESRIFTPDTDGVGTFGQRVPGIPANQAVATGETVDVIYIDNLSAADGFRTNFGLVDAGGTGVAYTLAAFNGSGDPIGTPFNGTVAANQWDQYNALGKLGVADTQNARVTFTVTSGKAIPYASQADNDTGDAMYIDATKIKSSGGGGGAACGTGMYFGYWRQVNNGTWEWSLNNGAVFVVDDYNLTSFNDPTPEDSENGDDFWPTWITATNYVMGLPLVRVEGDPASYLTFTDGGSFTFSISRTYVDDTNKSVLNSTWNFDGTFTCNFMSGNINALIQALDPDFKDYAGKWYWVYEAGMK